jgi:hypothetical protein
MSHRQVLIRNIHDEILFVELHISPNIQKEYSSLLENIRYGFNYLDSEIERVFSARDKTHLFFLPFLDFNMILILRNESYLVIALTPDEKNKFYTDFSSGEKKIRLGWVTYVVSENKFL